MHVFFHITFGIRDGMFIWCGYIVLLITIVKAGRDTIG